MMEQIRKLQELTYCNNNNYRIEYTNEDKKNCCAVYFSSNGIFFPNTVETFQKCILEQDRYEFTRMKIERADKHIFLRDIHKLWYAYGINPKVNNFTKLAEFIKKQSTGYKSLIFIGISGGGVCSDHLIQHDSRQYSAQFLWAMDFRI